MGLDWTAIIITFIGAGGLTAFITLTEKKAKAALENMQKTIDEWKALCSEERTEISTLRERVQVKQQQIDALYQEREEFMRERDVMSTDLAVAKILRCEHVGCEQRKPPLAQNLCGAGCEVCESTVSRSDVSCSGCSGCEGVCDITK